MAHDVETVEREHAITRGEHVEEITGTRAAGIQETPDEIARAGGGGPREESN